MNYRKLQVYFFMAIFALTLVLAFLVFQPYLSVMLFAGILAVLTQPVYRSLRRHFRGNATFAALGTVFLTLVLILLPLLLIGAMLVSELGTLFNAVRGNLDFEDIARSLSMILGPQQASAVAAEISRAVNDAATYVQPVVSNLTANVASFFADTVAFVLGFILLMMGMYYLLKDGAEFKRQLLELSPLGNEDDTSIIDRIIDAIKAVAYGQFVVSLIKGAIGGVTFVVLGLPAPVFWGTMVALTNFVPAVGTALVTVPFTIYLFATGRLWAGLALGGISLLVIGLVDNFLTPQVMKSRIKIHPMLILLSMLGGLKLFGAYGIFFGPIILSVTVALIDIYKKEFRASVERMKE